MKRPLVCVTWDDAHMSLDEYTPEEVKRDIHHAEQVRTYGILVQSDAEGVSLAQDEGVTDGKFRKLTFIPKGMVVEIREIPVSRRRKRKECRSGSDSVG